MDRTRISFRAKACPRPTASFRSPVHFRHRKIDRYRGLCKWDIFNVNCRYLQLSHHEVSCTQHHSRWVSRPIACQLSRVWIKVVDHPNKIELFRPGRTCQPPQNRLRALLSDSPELIWPFIAFSNMLILCSRDIVLIWLISPRFEQCGHFANLVRSQR